MPVESLPTPVRPPVQRVVLTGFMGAGKSTVGRVLAQKLHWNFTDLDGVIEDRFRLPVVDIFARHGEHMFRVAETEALKGLLALSPLVIALGGGAVTTEDVRTVLRGSKDTFVVYLQGSFSVLYERCRTQVAGSEAESRPLLGDVDTAAERYRTRLAVYEATADWTVDTTVGSPDEVATQIAARLQLL